MKIKSVIFMLFLICFLFSCTDNKKYYYDDYEECDYSSCNSEEPFYVELRIAFTRTSENPNPNIYIMRGFFENNNIIDTIKTDTIEDYLFYAEIWEALNYNYTVCAEYFVNDDTIWVIDGNYVYKKSYTECDSTCWSIYNKNFNVRLKY